MTNAKTPIERSSSAMVRVSPRPVARRRVNASVSSIAEARDYRRDDLFAVAEIAYHYLMNGGTKLALTLFEGLAAVSPREPYFALASGLCHDHEGNKRLAFECYERAASLDGNDPRPDINRAELHIENSDFVLARPLLQSGLRKALNSGDVALERKAAALLNHIAGGRS